MQKNICWAAGVHDILFGAGRLVELQADGLTPDGAPRCTHPYVSLTSDVYINSTWRVGRGWVEAFNLVWVLYFGLEMSWTSSFFPPQFLIPSSALVAIKINISNSCLADWDDPSGPWPQKWTDALHLRTFGRITKLIPCLQRPGQTRTQNLIQEECDESCMWQPCERFLQRIIILSLFLREAPAVPAAFRIWKHFMLRKRLS